MSEHFEQLETQRRLLDLPVGRERFARYLEVMTGRTEPGADALIRPLSLFNPMSKPHVAERLDDWIELGAEQLASEAANRAGRRLSAEGRNPELRTALVMVDDAAGGWTDRAATDLEHRFRDHHHPRSGWCPIVLWSSESPDPQTLTERVSASLARACHMLQSGPATTLAAMIAREAEASRFAERSSLKTSAAHRRQLDEVRKILETRRDAQDQATLIAALYGDQAAEQLGHQLLGLPQSTGLDLARSGRTLDD